MSKKKISQGDFEAILYILRQFPEGMTLEELSQKNTVISKRTLQRRLAHLNKEGMLKVEGKARNSKYKISWEGEKNKHFENGLIPLSPTSIDLQANVRSPISERKHVGYKIAFLNQYRPNETYYLGEQIRLTLLKWGKTDGERPAGTYARQIYNRLLIDLSWNSSRLEGNTYSLLETERLLELNESAKGKDIKEARMILNHKDAIEFLVDAAEEIGINRFTILNLHAILSNELLPDINACGRLRSIPVGIAKSVYHPLTIPHLIEEYFQQILDVAKAITDPFEQAFFLMVHLPYLQPFEDVNKRVSRLAANIPLIQHNLCPLSFVDVPEIAYVSGLFAVYELNRIELLQEVFVWAYQRSCLRYSNTRKELGEPDVFRLRYRTLISELIQEIVRGLMNKTIAIAAIRQKAQQSVPFVEQARFIEEVEKDLMSLHEGNIARHRLRLSEFTNWQKSWI